MTSKTYITNGFKETKQLGENTAEKTLNGGVLLLFGDLGSGKTTFIQGFAQGLGIQKRIISPTFIIIRHYGIKNQKSKIKDFYHVDLYRTRGNGDLSGIGLEEIIKDKNNILAIEWAENLGKLIPGKRIEIHCKYLDENKRKIIISNYE